jgi:hypothetical protein
VLLAFLIVSWPTTDPVAKLKLTEDVKFGEILVERVWTAPPSDCSRNQKTCTDEIDGSGAKAHTKVVEVSSSSRITAMENGWLTQR